MRALHPPGLQPAPSYRPPPATIDPDPTILTSPCDAIVGASGTIEGDQLIQAKGLTYTLLDLLRDPELVRLYRDGGRSIDRGHNENRRAGRIRRSLHRIRRAGDPRRRRNDPHQERQVAADTAKRMSTV